MVEVVRFYGHSLFVRPSGGRYFFTIHYSLFTQLTPSGGSIFRCTAKDRGERRAKGIAIPLNPLGVMFWRMPDVLCAYVFATVRLTRLSRAWRAQAHCFHALCVLRCLERLKDLRNHPTSDYKLSWLFYECYAFAAVGAVQSSPWKQCGARHGRA